MATPEYATYSPSVVFQDDVGGVGGTDYIAVNMNGLRDDLATYVENHFLGTANRHGSMDILDYNSVNGSPYRLLETTPYANAATSVANANTAWQRFDMFAKEFKDIIGGVGGDLTTRHTDYFTTLTGGNGSLTTLWNLTHGGSPTFGTVTGIAPSVGVPAGAFRGTTADPDSQNVLDVTNNAGATHYFLVTAPSVASSIPAIVQSRGTFVGIATSNAFATMQARSLDATAGRKVISAQNNSAVEGAYITNDGQGGFKAGLALIDQTLPGSGVAGQTLIVSDAATHTVRFNQNNAGWVTIGSAAAAGSGAAALGGVQYTTGSGVFAADTENFWDHTDKRLALGFSAAPAPLTTLDINGAMTFRAMTLPGVSTTSPDDAILAYDTATHQLKLSQNGVAFSPLVQQSIAGTQNLQSTGGSVNLQGLTGTFVHGQFTQDTSGYIASQGPGGGFRGYDRSGSPGNSFFLYRGAALIALNSDEFGDLLYVNASTGGIIAKHIQATAGGVGLTPGNFITLAGQTADAFVIDATATATGGMKQAWDKNGHSYKTGGTPVLSATNAGTGGSVTISGNDEEGIITVVTGSGAVPSASTLMATVTFALPWASTPKGVMILANQGNAQGLAAAAFPVQGTVSTTAFNFVSGTSAMTISTTYKFFYKVIL